MVIYWIVLLLLVGFLVVGTGWACYTSSDKNYTDLEAWRAWLAAMDRHLAELEAAHAEEVI